MCGDCSDAIGGDRNNCPDEMMNIFINEFKHSEGVSIIDIHVVAFSDAVKNKDNHRENCE